MRRGYIYGALTDEVSVDVGSLHLKCAVAGDELLVVSSVSGVIERHVVEVDDMAVPSHV